MSDSWLHGMRDRLSHINVLTLDQMRALPEAKPFEAGLYFLWQGDELLWIGKTNHILERINRQARNQKYDRFQVGARGIPFDRYTCLVLEAEANRLPALMQDVERAYLATYEPPYNRTDANGGT